MEEIQDLDIEEILKAFPKLKDKEKANIKWLLLSFNPVPLEFYRYLNRKTKHTSVTLYVCAISAILTLSEGISEDRMLLFQNIQKRWSFKNDWNTYIAERSALMAIKSSYRVQKDYNNEVSSQYPKKRKRDDPSTPNKPVIRLDIKQKYPQVAFLKKVKFAPEEPEDENPFRSKNSAERDNQNVVDPVNWREWLENVLE
ncbi:5778_t:CDS:2, partial [Funneliformis geosporum]